MKKRAVFLDRDGTLNEEVGYLDSMEKLRILPGAIEAVRLLNRHDLLTIVVTNQSGIARGYFDETFVNALHEKIRQMFLAEGAILNAFYYCPHHPEGSGKYQMRCSCRKPEPGLLETAAKEWEIDLSRSWMIGDMLKDILAGKRAGCKGILVKTGNPEVKETLEVQPDYIAANILDAANWIVGYLEEA
ncbi:MAG: D-glycero-beta-D-manno-heptose 1,7-bisphosphate 7-phosphatase [Syntrophales bacterium]|nr:D-glycero-beta-D-manno-heptose 1,7-bisphosphate 7-phosphatase [Syntrophales bacterium]